MSMGESAVSAPTRFAVAGPDPAALRRLAADEDFHGHLTDTSRSVRWVHPSIAPDSPTGMVQP